MTQISDIACMGPMMLREVIFMYITLGICTDIQWIVMVV